MTDTPDPIGELIERLRAGPIREGEGPEGIELFDIEDTHESMHEAANTLSALQGQVRELEVAVDVHQVICRRQVSEASHKDATIARLRDALERLQRAGSELESFMGKLHLMDDETILGSDLVANGLNDRLDELRAALAREPKTPEENG